ncbi:MAG: response regulator [bacterium]|nr:response regulator [bacterium]MDT8365631.1 response regulator [bacterium]
MKKILVVEDSVLVQRIIQDALEINFPCIIMGVENGARAYEELKVNTYDLVVTDIVMPIMGGLILAEKIRVDLASDVPIIMLTSLGVKNVRDFSLHGKGKASFSLSLQIDDFLQSHQQLTVNL